MVGCIGIPFFLRGHRCGLCMVGQGMMHICPFCCVSTQEEYRKFSFSSRNQVYHFLIYYTKSRLTNVDIYTESSRCLYIISSPLCGPSLMVVCLEVRLRDIPILILTRNYDTKHKHYLSLLKTKTSLSIFVVISVFVILSISIEFNGIFKRSLDASISSNSDSQPST